MCNAIPILSPFIFILSLYPSFLIGRIFLFSSLPSFFMHACIHKVQWIHRRQGAKAPKKLPFFQTMVYNVGLRVCAKFYDQCFMLIIMYKVICSNCLRLVAILITIKLCCHDNGNVGLHVCAEFHDHTYTVLYAHSKV